jgi:hypothetical protein
MLTFKPENLTPLLPKPPLNFTLDIKSGGIVLAQEGGLIIS